MEFFTSLATGVVSKIGEMLFEPIGAKCAYLISYDDNINNMKEALKTLENRKREVQLRVDADKENGREIVPAVEEWLREVEAIQRELGSFSEEATRNSKCFGGWCPNLNTRYSFSKKAKENKTKLVHLKEQKPETISTPAPPLKYGAIFTSKGIKSFESRNRILSAVVEKLKDEECNRISICGMGGVGKTTLVKEVVKIVEAEKLFGEIVMVTVSQTVDYRKIQGEIADRLRLKLDNKESLQGRAQKLLHGIINKSARVLIVLDDVWTELNFEAIGLPSNEDHKAFKVIFTSRNEGVCSKMGSQKNFTVDTLSKENSWALFQEMTGGDVVKNPEIYPIAEDIANKCGGLPIAIVTVGKALLGKKEKYIWEDALNELRKSSGSFSDVEKCIELSYNLLDREQAKYFLFLCCSFPEDADIPIEVLLREGWGLGFFRDQEALWKARNKAHTLMNDLKTCYLLLDSKKKECVKMHDVVRDVITSIASKEENDFKIQCDAEKWWQEKSTRNSSSAVSIMINKVKECPNVEEYPKLKLLRVACTWRRISIPTTFFQGMSKLKVLCLEKVSPLFPTLNNLRTLRLEHCQVGDASIIGSELPTLEILSFANSNIKEVPIEIGQLGSLRLLDLTGCNELYKFSSNVLARLFRLEELYFGVTNSPRIQNNDFLIELKNISHQLKVVEIRVRRVEPFFKDMIFENVQRFWVYVMPYYNFGSHGYMDSNILHLRAVNYNSIKCSMPIKHLVKRCEILVIEKVKNLKSVICGLEEDTARLQRLKYLKISSCSNLEYLIDDGEDRKSMSDFSNLVNLELEELPKLIRFNKARDLNKSNQSMPYFPTLETISIYNCNSLEMTFDLQGFQNLRVLTIRTCHSLSQIFTSAIGRAILELKKLEIKQCNQLVNLVGGSKDNEDEDYQAKRKVKTVVFNKLHYLSLFNLPKLESFYANSYGLECPSLRELYINRCPMLKTLPFQNQMLQGGNSLDMYKFLTLETISISNCDSLEMAFDLQGFQNLRALTISNCDSLTHIFTPAFGKVAPELEELKINWCKQMTNLVGGRKVHEDEDYKARGKVETIVFNKLHSLSLFGLPKLESICSNFYDLEWPCLRQLDIDRCPMLKTPSFQTQMLAMQDNAGISSYSNIHSNDSGNSKENKSRPFNWLLGCAPLPPKFIHQANKNKTSNKATTLAQDQISSIFKLKSMPILEDIHVRRCDLLDILFSLEDPTNLSFLKSIKIEDCDKLEYIMAKREKRTEMMNYFAQLQSLDLKNLPNLLRFCFSGTCTSFDKDQDMGACEGDRSRIKLDPLIDVFLFPNLRSLFIEGCSKICILFSLSSLRSLKCLEKLHLKDCENIEEIVSHEHIETSADKIMYHEFQYLLLEGLPNLKAFSQGSSDFDFPSLRRVRIEGCPNMEMFSRGSLNTPQLKDFKMKIEPHVSNYIHKGDLNATIKGFKAFVELQGSDMLSWNDPYNEGIIYFKISEIDIKMFHKLLVIVPFNEIHMLHDVRKLNITECGSLVEVFESKGEVEAKEDVITHFELRSMNLKKLPKLRHIWGPSIMRLLSFNKLTSIVIEECGNLESLLSHSMVRSLMQLQELSITNCEMMEEMVTMEDKNRDDGVDAKKGDVIINYELRSMKLEKLPKLRHIWGSNIMGLVSFDKLTSIKIIRCHSLKSLMSHSMAKSLVQLEELCIKGCQMMEEIVTKEYENKHKSNKVKNLFPKLKMLVLVNLPTLKCFCSRDYDYDLPLCDGKDKKIEKIDVTRCHNLLSLASFIEMHMLQHAKHLNISQCDSLVEVFGSEGGLDAKKGDATTHYKIESMELEGLPKLSHIWGPNITRLVSFNRLTSIVIAECHSLKSLLSHSMAIGLVQLQKLFVTNCKMMEEIVTMEEEKGGDGGNKVKTLFPKLNKLELRRLPKLECVCSRDYGYNIPLCHEEEEEKEINNKQQIQISLPQLQQLKLYEVPRLKCFCLGAYDYDLMLSLSCVEDCPQSTTFPKAKVTVITPNLHKVHTSDGVMRTTGDLNLTIHYFHNPRKYKVELQDLETFRCIEQLQYQHLLAYIMTETSLVLESCHKLLSCIPSNMMHLFQHLTTLKARQCGCLEEIFESNDYEGIMELTWMELYSLPKLKHIWRNHGQMLGFQNLRDLKISQCHDLKSVFPNVSVARSLPSLLYLEVHECNKMEEIIQHNNNNSTPEWAEIKFPNLLRIELKKLPKLNCFCPSSFDFELPRCRQIDIEECPKMETFSYGNLFINSSFYSFSVGGRKVEVKNEEDVNEIIQEIRSCDDANYNGAESKRLNK